MANRGGHFDIGDAAHTDNPHGLSAFSGNAAESRTVSLSVGRNPPAVPVDAAGELNFDFERFRETPYSLGTPQGNEFVGSADLDGSGDYEDFENAFENLFGITGNVDQTHAVQDSSHDANPLGTGGDDARDDTVADTNAASTPCEYPIDDELLELANRKDPLAHDLVTAAVLSLAPVMIGPNKKMFCGHCAHPGHFDINALECPAGRLIRYFQHRPTLYQTLDGHSAALLFNSDVMMLQDGLTFACRVMASKECELEVFGITVGTVAFLKKMLELARPLEDEELLRFAQGIPADCLENFGLFEAHKLHPKVLNSESAANGHRDRLVEPTRSLQVTIQDVLNVLVHGQEEQAEVTRRYMDPMYKVRQSLAASKTAPKTAPKSSKPGPKPGPKKKLGKHHIRHKIAHDPYAYIDAPIIGLRGNVRCTNCFHLGHAPNASKICPVEVVNRAVISSINRTKSSWTRMQWELQTLYESLKSVIQQMEEEDDGEGLAQNKIRWVVAEFEKLNPTTGRPLDQVPNIETLRKMKKEEKERIKLAIKIMQERTGKKHEPKKNAEGEDEEYDSDCSSAIEFPEDFPYPELPPLADHKVIDVNPWVEESGIPEIDWFRGECPIPQLGNRNDAQCPNCLGWGHDSRYLDCPFVKVQAALVEKNRSILLMQDDINALRTGHDWQFSLPPHHRKSTETIKGLWERLMEDKYLYENKLVHYHPDYKPPTWVPQRKTKRKADDGAAQDPKRLNLPGPGFHATRAVPHRPAPLVPRGHMQYRGGDQPSVSTAGMTTGGLLTGFTANTKASTPMTAGGMAGFSLKSAGLPDGGNHLYLDHTKTPAGLLMQAMQYVVDDGDENAFGLKLDQSRLPVNLLMKIGQYLVAPPEI